LTAAEKERLEASYNPVHDIFLDISVMNGDASSWGRGDDMILRYSLNRNEFRIAIESHLGYDTSFSEGGPIAPLNYITPTFCPFKWDFPILDFKILNNRTGPLFLTEVIFDVEESRADLAPLFAIRKDTQQSFAGELRLTNEGWCDLTDLRVSFHLFPGIGAPLTDGPPYPHSITIPRLEDRVELDVAPAFQREGIDFDGLILLANGEWETRDTFVAPNSEGLLERMSKAELDERWKKHLGRFQEEVGTLAGEIRFVPADGSGRERRVKFNASVYLTNKNRRGIHKPPTFTYDTAFEAQKAHYQRRVPISHTLQPGEADRLTVKVAVPQSSFHRYRATLRDISGLALQSLPIEMSCFVPRSRRQRVQEVIARMPTE
jgi:hypothetical protein